MRKIQNLKGRRFGRLKVIDFAGRDKHGNALWRCRCDCGTLKTCHGSRMNKGDTRSCGCWQKEKAREAMNRTRRNWALLYDHPPNWRGGRCRTKDGYISVRTCEYPGQEGIGVTIGEHRLVMAKHLGRPLLSDEHVHHKNGQRDDNRLENLELMTTNHPYGQRVVDKVQWAKELLRRYEPAALVA